MLSVRARAIIICDDMIALIERHRAGRHYYVFPGGGVEPGETSEEAAAREVAEELGLVVAVGKRVAEVVYASYLLRFFLATPIGGTFGTGHGPEVNGRTRPERGTYHPTWLPLDNVLAVEVLPRVVAEFIVRTRAAGWSWPGEDTPMQESSP